MTVGRAVGVATFRCEPRLRAAAVRRPVTLLTMPAQAAQRGILALICRWRSSAIVRLLGATSLPVAA